MPRKRKTRLLLAAAIVLLALLGIAYWVVAARGVERLDVWQPATVPYEAGCEPRCVEIAPFAPGHGAEPPGDAEAMPMLVYNPEVDDAVAQWGDCLQSIMSCVLQGDPEDGVAADTCVREAACPAACTERYGTIRGESNDMDAVERALFATFVDRDAPCRPEEPAP